MTDVLNSVNPQQKPNINELKFDVLKIDSRIKKDSQFEEDGTIFQFCPEYHPESIDESDQKSDYVKYIAKIKNPSFQYILLYLLFPDYSALQSVFCHLVHSH